MVSRDDISVPPPLENRSICANAESVMNTIPFLSTITLMELAGHCQVPLCPHSSDPSSKACVIPSPGWHMHPEQTAAAPEADGRQYLRERDCQT